jgi:hypothetical protein
VNANFHNGGGASPRNAPNFRFSKKAALTKAQSWISSLCLRESFLENLDMYPYGDGSPTHKNSLEKILKKTISSSPAP